MSIWMKLFHIVTAIWFISGMIGRWAAYRRSATAADLPSLAALMRLGEFFDRRMVIPGSQAVLLFGLLTAWLQGWPILGSLQGSPINWVFVSLILYLSDIPIVIAVLAPQRKIRERALAEALETGAITPALKSALSNQTVTIARLYEAGITAAILVLMVLKPF